MSLEVKTSVADTEDLAAQAGLELQIRAREAKGEAKQKATGEEGGPPLTDKIKHAQDLKKQVGLEVDKQSRDAKLAIEKKATSSGADAKLSHAGDALVDVKDNIAAAFQPDTKAVPAESTRGVDITHVENPANERLAARRAEEKRRAERDAEREKEKKRQDLVDDMKAKASAAGGAIKHAADVAGVAIGNAALSLKSSIDASMDERPREKVTPRVSEKGVDISAVQNARNEELLAEERKIRQAEKEAVPEKGAGEKLKDKLDHAVESLKQGYEEATTDPPKPVYVRKLSASGVDVSHCENPNNAALAAAEEEQLRQEKEKQLAIEKAKIDAQLVEPGKEAAAEKGDTLKAKMSALGSSISRAAHKLGDSISSKFDELANPPPVEVHEKKSERGIDTTSIQNADNNKIGEEIKNRPILASASSADKAKSKDASSKQSTEDAVVKGVLDAGVAVKEKVEGLKQQTAAATEPSQRQPIATNPSVTAAPRTTRI